MEPPLTLHRPDPPGTPFQDFIIIDGFILDNFSGLSDNRILLSSARNCVISGCEIRDATDNGISITNGSSRTLVINNMIVSANTNGIQVNNSNDVQIFHNSISLSTNEGVDVTASSRVTILNNVLSESGGLELNVDTASESTVVEDFNLFDHSLGVSDTAATENLIGMGTTTHSLLDLLDGTL